tara:strand:- start:2697 stop:4451 length:1755 start_codon:yes stop_codon:yes gene_type:complete
MINLPEIFKRDTQSKDTYLVPLIVIKDSIFLSTGKIALDGQYYDPLVKSMGKIKDSINLFNKSFRVSSMYVDLFNYEYNNKRLVDVLFKSEIINKEIDIYYKSQSAQNLSDCLKVYSGYIKEIKENKDILRLDIEDFSEHKLSTETPNKLTSDEIIPEADRNQVIPISYGFIEKCPLIRDASDIYNSIQHLELKSDYHYIKDLRSPMIYYNNNYAFIDEESSFDFPLDTSNNTVIPIDGEQYTIDENTKIMLIKDFAEIDIQDDATISSLGYTLNSLQINKVQTTHEAECYFTKGEYKESNSTSTDVNIDTADVNSYSSSEGDEKKYLVDENGVYIRPDFPLDDEIAAYPFYWCYGKVDSQSDEYESIYGQSVLCFNSDEYIAKEKVYKPLFVILRIGAATVYGQHSPGSAGQNPLVRLHWQNSTNPNDNIQLSASDAGLTPPITDLTLIYESNIDFAFQHSPSREDIFYDKNIVFTQRDSSGTLQIQDGIARWMRFQDMKYERRAILNDFSSYKIFATIEGRVDNADYRYTSSTTILSSERVESSFGQEKEIYRPEARASSGRPSRQRATKAPIKTRITKGGY